MGKVFFDIGVLFNYLDSFLLKESISDLIKNNLWITLLLMGLFLNNFLKHHHITDILKRKDINHKTKLAEEQYKYLSISDCDELSYNLRHDYEKHLTAIVNLIETENYKQLKEYAEIISKSMNYFCIKKYTDNSVIDVILSEKDYQAKNQGIYFYVTTEKLGDVLQNAFYISAIFGNVLENAVEECERQINKGAGYTFINVRLYKDEKLNGLIFSVRNSSDKPILYEGKYLTQKGLSRNHGYGIHNIETVLDKINGICTYGYDNSTFVFIAKIPLTE